MDEVYFIHIKHGNSKDDYTLAIKDKTLFDLAAKSEDSLIYSIELPEGTEIPEDYEDSPEDYTFSEHLYHMDGPVNYPVILLGETELWNY